LRLTAVGLAVLLWLWVTVERRGERPAEKIVDATVTYNPPPGMMILDRQGPVEVRLTPDDVMMPEGLEVVSIEPNVLQLHVDQEVRRLLPVEVPLIGEPAAGAQLAGRPRITPGEVLVTGPRKLVSALSTVRANPISLD